MKLAAIITVSVLFLFSIFYFFYSKIHFYDTRTEVKFNPEDINDFLDMRTIPMFEPIPNEEIETIIQKIDDSNFDRYDLVKGTDSGWVYEIRNNNMTLKTQIKDKINHGKYSTFHQNQKLRSAGKYKEGKKDGLWVQFFENGQQMNYGKFKNGKEIDKWIFYDSLGGYVFEERIYDSLENRYSFEQFDSTLNRISDGYFLNKKRHGEWNFFFKNSDLAERKNYQNGLLHGKFEKWFDNGNFSISHFKNGKVNGIVKFYTKDHQLYKKAEFEMDSLIWEKDIKIKKK